MVQPIQKALVYCRVSSTKQKKGSGLESQQHRCIQYADSKQYGVEKIFQDDVSGGGDFMNRKGMVELLKYLKKNNEHNYVVIFDDLKRFARDTMFHLKLRAEFAQYQVKIECLNYHFEDTPEGKFVETIHAAQGQLEREQIGRQTTQKMHARLEQGYAVFRAPVGYKYEKSKGGGKILVLDNPIASIIKESLLGFASGRFQTQSEIMYFMESFPEYPKNGYGKVVQQRVKDILTNVIYAGHIEYKEWNISLRKGHHEPLISLATYNKIQELLLGKAKVPARKSLNEEFPLRGFVHCDECKSPLTASFSKGQTKRYPYYHCHNTHGCSSYKKSIRRADIEGEFEKLLISIAPSKKLFGTIKIMFDDIRNFRSEYLNKRTNMLNSQLIDVDHKIEKLIDLIIESKSPSVTQSFERRMKNLEHEKLLIDEKIAKSSQSTKEYSGSLRTILKFLENPYVLYNTRVLANQRAVLKLVFADNLTWLLGHGLRTINMSLLFKDLEGIFEPKIGENKLASPRGFEPLLPP